MTTRAERRNMLLLAARDVVLRFGYRKTTIEDIAAEAGVSRATVYNCFPNKDEVFRSIVAAEIDRLRDAIERGIDPASPPDERLLQLVQARYGRLREIKRLYAVAMDAARDVMAIAMAELAAFHAAQVELVAGILREGIASGRFRQVNPDALAHALLSALRGLDEAFVFEDQEALAQGAECLLQTLITGLLAEGRR